MARAERLHRGRRIDIGGTDLATEVPGHIRKVPELDGGLVLGGIETVLGVIHGLVALTDVQGLLPGSPRRCPDRLPSLLTS